jgi:hypothetical protein
MSARGDIYGCSSISKSQRDAASRAPAGPAYNCNPLA